MGKRKPNTALPPVVVTIRREATPSALAAWARLWRLILSEKEKPPAGTGGGEEERNGTTKSNSE